MDDIEVIETFCGKNHDPKTKNVLILKIMYKQTSQITHMKLESAAKKYPQAILNYLMNRINVKKKGNILSEK